MFEPTNEQGVVVLFVQCASMGGIDILKIQTQFPDAVISLNGEIYRAEFEFLASNFIIHNHDIRNCDIVICWKNDLPDFALPVIELSSSNWYIDLEIKVPNDIEKSVAYWCNRAQIAEAKLERMSDTIKDEKSRDGYYPKGETIRKIFVFNDSQDGDILDYLAKRRNVSRTVREAIRLLMNYDDDQAILKEILQELMEIKQKQVRHN